MRQCSCFHDLNLVRWIKNNHSWLTHCCAINIILRSPHRASIAPSSSLYVPLLDMIRIVGLLSTLCREWWERDGRTWCPRSSAVVTRSWNPAGSLLTSHIGYSAWTSSVLSWPYAPFNNVLCDISRDDLRSASISARTRIQCKSRSEKSEEYPVSVLVFGFH